MLRQPSQSVFHVIRQRRDFRIHQNSQRHFAFIGVARVVGDFEHRELFRCEHLIRRQADAIVLFHGLDHVVDESLHRRALEFFDGDIIRNLTQHRMSQARDFKNGHGEVFSIRAKREKEREQGGAGRPVVSACGSST